MYQKKGRDKILIRSADSILSVRVKRTMYKKGGPLTWHELKIMSLADMHRLRADLKDMSDLPAGCPNAYAAFKTIYGVEIFFARSLDKQYEFKIVYTEKKVV